MGISEESLLSSRRRCEHRKLRPESQRIQCHVSDDESGPERLRGENLVDPTEGGQATNLAVQVAASPENPVNDETADKNGDTVTANTIIDNASQSQSNILYEWSVDMDTSPRFSSPTDITSDLIARGLIGNTKGAGLDSLSIKLDLPATVLGAISGGIGYLRIKVKVEESFEEVDRDGDAVISS